MKELLQISIPSCLRNVETVCSQVILLLKDYGYVDKLYAVDLILREFLNNAIVHGNKSDPGRTVKTAMTIEDSRLGIVIEDEGPGFDWQHQYAEIPEDDQTSGRGLAIGRIYATELRFNAKGNRVEIGIELTKDTEHDRRQSMQDAEFIMEEKTLTIRLGPRLVAEQVPGLQEKLKAYLNSGVRHVIFDFKAVAALDSTGIGLLIATGNSLKELDGQVSVRSAAQDIVKLLRSMRLAERLGVMTGNQEA